MKKEIIIFGGGCFWCTEAVFKMLQGVESVLPGYAGGHTPNPTYYSVSNGDTGYAECVEVVYNPEIIELKDLLTVFFGSHDPTTPNRQGNDVGTQYRSVIFYTNDHQQKIIKDFIEEINLSTKDGAPIVTEIQKLDKFFVAEDFHKNYYENNKTQAYCELVINPKLDKVIKQYAHLLQKQS